MVVSVLSAEFRLPGADTLKEKRQVVQSLLRRTAQRFRLSIAEVGWQDQADRLRLGAAVVSTAGVHGERVLHAVLDFIEREYPVELMGAGVERR